MSEMDICMMEDYDEMIVNGDLEWYIDGVRLSDGSQIVLDILDSEEWSEWN